MAHNVSNEYKQIIYSGDARNKLKLLFNNVELQDADRYCERMTVKSRIVPNGAKIFSLNNFISKEVELILHDIDTSIIQDQVSISIGTLVGNNYEYVPIGIFNIENQPTNDKNKTTIKLRDNSVKFDFNYNAQPLIEENGGSATKLQILQDICTQAGVTCNITSFIGYLDEIGIYDNTVTARKYIADIAEQAGKIATINRSGELIFVDLNNLTTWEIPIEIVEKYESGTKFKVGKVVYEDGIVRYETEDSNDDTLFLDGSNDYINGEKVVEQASSNNNSYSLQNTGEAKLKYFQLEGETTQETRSGKNLLKNIATTQTINGVTFTVNNDKTITANGTATAQIVLVISDSITLSGNYVLSGCPSGGSSSTYELQLYGVSGAVDYGSGKTISSGTGVARIVIRNGVTVNNIVFKPMISANWGEYEQYGIMPSPDYPSELVSVGYENIFNKNGTINGQQTTTILDTGVRITQPTSGTYKYNYISLGGSELLGKTITISSNIVSSASNKGQLSLYYANSSNPAISFVGNLAATGSATFTIANSFPSNASRVNLLLYSNTNGVGNANDYTDFTNLIITKDTQTHSYIPYGKYGIEVKTTGKNLLPNDVTAQTINNITSIVNEDGSITFNGTASAFTRFYILSIGHSIPINAGTYTLSVEKSGTASAGDIYMNINFTSLGLQYFYVPNVTYKNITLSSNDNITNASITFAQGVSLTNFTIKPQLEAGSTQTSYKSYQSNTQAYQLDNPLRSIGNIKDLLYIKNGMLYVDRKIGSVVLDGSERYYYENEGQRFTTAVSGSRTENTRNPILSNYFRYGSSGNADGIAFNYGGVIYLYNYDYNTTTDLKTWLSTHNAEVQYVLATPYTEELGQVEMPSTYEGITYLDISSSINTNSYLQYRQNKTQLEAILQNTNQFSIDSLKTGKILGNPAIDSYDLIQIHDTYKDETYTTLATNDLVYTGVLINTFDTQIGEEAKEQNVFVNGEETFKKWARTKIDNVEGALTLQAGEINEVNGKLNTTTLQLSSQGALLNVLANNSNIDVEYDNEGNPLSGEVREVTTTTGFKFNADGMTIEDSSSNFKSLHRNTGVTYYDGTTIVGQYTKDGSKQKDLDLFGVYTYGKNNINETPMFVAQLYTDANGEEAFGHFYNRGD